MSAQDHLNDIQFKQHKTMSVHAVGKLTAADYGTSMNDMAGDDYARWEMDQGSNKYAGTDAFEDLSSSVEEHGVQKPLEISTAGNQRGEPPRVIQGHHRYQAAYDTGQSRVPVTGAVRAAKAFAHYTPPDNIDVNQNDTT